MKQVTYDLPKAPSRAEMAWIVTNAALENGGRSFDAIFMNPMDFNELGEHRILDTDILPSEFLKRGRISTTEGNV